MTVKERGFKAGDWGEINELSSSFSISPPLCSSRRQRASGSCLDRESEAGTLIHALNSFHAIPTLNTLAGLMRVQLFLKIFHGGLREIWLISCYDLPGQVITNTKDKKQIHPNLLERPYFLNFKGKLQILKTL